jgi:tetratricopeptide (TPR) repeat protein
MAENLLAKHQANPKENVLAQIDYTLIAGEFSDAKRADEAITVVEDAIQAYPSASHFYKTLAYAYIDKENYAKASDAYQQYTSKLEKPSYNDYLQAGKLSYFAGISAEDDATKATYLNRAVDYANKAKSTDSANYSADKLLGDVKIANAGKADNGSALTDYQNAISKLEQASDASKYASDARKMCYYVANYYYTKGDNSGAKTYYQKGLVYDPDNTEIKNFVQKLK